MKTVQGWTVKTNILRISNSIFFFSFHISFPLILYIDASFFFLVTTISNEICATITKLHHKLVPWDVLLHGLYTLWNLHLKNEELRYTFLYHTYRLNHNYQWIYSAFFPHTSLSFIFFFTPAIHVEVLWSRIKFHLTIWIHIHVILNATYRYYSKYSERNFCQTWFAGV